MFAINPSTGHSRPFCLCVCGGGGGERGGLLLLFVLFGFLCLFLLQQGLHGPASGRRWIPLSNCFISFTGFVCLFVCWVCFLAGGGGGVASWLGPWVLFPFQVLAVRVVAVIFVVQHCRGWEAVECRRQAGMQGGERLRQTRHHKHMRPLDRLPLDHRSEQPLMAPPSSVSQLDYIICGQIWLKEILRLWKSTSRIEMHEEAAPHLTSGCLFFQVRPLDCCSFTSFKSV